MERVIAVVLLGLLVALANCQNIVITSNNPVIEGNDFVFNCNDTDNNGLTIRLTVISGTSRQANGVPANGDDRTFTLSDVQRSENNTVFRCSLGGSDFEDITLVVYFRASYTSPSVTEALFCGTPLDVSFDIMEGFPMSTFSLTRNSNSFTLPPGRGIEVDATGIRIPSLEVSDAGEYVFSVTNEAGMTNVSLSLTVYCGPNLRAGNNASTDLIINEGGMFTVDCTVTQSVPTATIYLVIEGNTPMDITNNPVRTFTDVRTSSAGMYQCRASSGQAITTFTYNIRVNQAVRNSVTPSTAMPSPSVTPPQETPTDGASVLKMGTFAIMLVLVAITMMS